MNTFEDSFYIGDKYYHIFVDSSKNEQKRIVINNKEIINEDYTLAFNSKAYIIYYPIDIDGNELVVAIDDKPIVHIYNLYLNNVSLIDGSQLDNEYLNTKLIVENGFKAFVKNNWFEILKNALLFIIFFNIASIVYDGFDLKSLIYTLLISPLFSPVFILIEW